MKVSMNGFRKRLSGEVETLRDLVGAFLVRGEFIDADDLRNAMNDVICSSNALNCIYNPGDPDFVEMANVRVEELEEI